MNVDEWPRNSRKLEQRPVNNSSRIGGERKGNELFCDMSSCMEWIDDIWFFSFSILLSDAFFADIEYRLEFCLPLELTFVRPFGWESFSETCSAFCIDLLARNRSSLPGFKGKPDSRKKRRKTIYPRQPRLASLYADREQRNVWERKSCVQLG